METLPKVVVLCGWLLNYIVWFVTDTRVFSERIKFFLSLRQLSYAVTSVVIVVLSTFMAEFFYWPTTKFDSVIATLGIAVFIIGLVISIWAKLTMKSSWGVPFQHDIKRQKKLVQSGPFAFSRNPIYLGLILMFFGHFIALRSNLIIFAFLGAWYFYSSALKEEGFLEKFFGKDYLVYKKRVPRFI